MSQCNKLVSLTDPENETFAFTSPGYPNGYSQNLDCNWIFTSPPGTHLVFQIQVMDLEETSDCVADYVAVYSGNALDANTGSLLKQECLSNSTSMKIIGTNVMTVKFVSDFSVNGTGFKGLVYRGILHKITFLCFIICNLIFNSICFFYFINQLIF